MVKIRQFHIRSSDVITGVLSATAPLDLPLQIYLSNINMTVFIRVAKSKGTGRTHSFRGTVVYGRHPSAKIDSDASGFVASEVIPFIKIEDSVDVEV